MPRGYRHALIAALGCLILANGQEAGNHKAGEYAHTAQHQRAARQQPLARSVGKLESSEPQKQTTCRNPQGEAEISACASLAQAAAANTANELSRRALNWNIAGIIVVTLTLIATAIASWAATSAVRHTRRIGEAQTRAYLSIVSVKGRYFDSGLVFKVRVLNSGQSPALSAQVMVDVICPDGSKVRIMPEVEHPVPSQGKADLALCYFNNIEAQSWNTSIVVGCTVGFADVFGTVDKVEAMFAGIPGEWHLDSFAHLVRGGDIASYLRAVGLEDERDQEN